MPFKLDFSTAIKLEIFAFRFAIVSFFYVLTEVVICNQFCTSVAKTYFGDFFLLHVFDKKIWHFFLNFLQNYFFS